MLERASDRWVSIVLSVLLHGTLVVALVYGFWTYRQSRPPTPTLAIEATVVDSRTLSGAAKTPPEPEPKVPPAPEPVEPTGPPEPTPEELALREQALKEQAQKEQAQKEQAQKEQAEKEQAERDAVEQQRKLEGQKQQEDAQRQAEEHRQAQEKADAERKAAEAKKRAEEQRVAEQKRAEATADAKNRAESEAELRNDLAAEEHANQLRSSGALTSWMSQIQGRIQRAWLRPPSARAGIQCVLHITQAPGGAVVSARIESCNGDQAVRESIEAAAYRASPLPPPPDPSLFERDLEVTFKPD
jgi:colicin import membrane protein